VDGFRLTLLGVCGIALALVISYASFAKEDLSPLARVQITGATVAPLTPGAAVPVDLKLENPNTFAIAVPGVRVTIDGTSSPTCETSNFTVDSQLYRSVWLPASATRSLSQLGISRTDWPRIAMIDSSASQDKCENATVQLSYASKALAGEPADTPIARSAGRIRVNGRDFEHGGLAFGARVWIRAGGRLESSTPVGNIVLRPPLGGSIRFILNRVPARPGGRAYAELKLAGGGLWRCPARVSSGALVGATAPTAPERGLWAGGPGRVAVDGRFGVATGRNAWWLTRDTCRGTLFKVERGTVRVIDVTEPRPVLVRAGESYLAHTRLRMGPQEVVGRR
jgi:hypothetical protein